MRIQTTLALALIASLVQAEPVANWVRLNGFPEEYRNGLTRMHAQLCLPDSEFFKFPVYPEAEVFGITFGPKKPDCTRKENYPSHKPHTSLVSRAPNREVVNWYREQLPNANIFEADGGTAISFSAANTEEWSNNPWVAPFILIRKSSAVTFTAGYPTLITFHGESF